ncbi:MAG: TIGR03790 family protein [Armatimonadetes bacterium]|nr:TIGR03790 family protein [Armatimonadota bacterium]
MLRVLDLLSCHRGRRALWLFLVLVIACPAVCLAGGGRRNVVVVANSGNLSSVSLADYYRAQRNLPQNHLIFINCPSDEVVNWETFDARVRRPIRDAIVALERAGRQIDYIVLTRGTPLMATRGSAVFSVTSVLTCLSEPDIDDLTVNPYGPTTAQIGGFGGTATVASFSHSLNLFGRHLYLVSRLDGYSDDLVRRMIDDTTIAKPGGAFLIDRRPGLQYLYKVMDDRLGLAASLLRSRGTPVIEENTSAFATAGTDLAGYFSWGSNDPAFSRSLYLSYRFRPGSIADTYVSTSGRTFMPGTAGGQSLLADLLPGGLSAGGAYVAEPYAALADYPDVICDRYTLGYNAVESLYAACPEVFWRQVTIGDPLLAPYSTPPQVQLSVRDGAQFTNAISVTATAVDAQGVQRVEFYLDDKLVSTSYRAPFSADVDARSFSRGQHRLEAIAYEAGPVATQGSAAVSVNLVSSSAALLSAPSQAFGMPDGSNVVISPAVVTLRSGADTYWITAFDGSSGIEVLGNAPLQAGDFVIIQGQITSRNGHRAIVQQSWQKLGTTIPAEAVSISASYLGGVSPSMPQTPSAGARGAYNVGRSVQVSGFVESVDAVAGQIILSTPSGSVRVQVVDHSVQESSPPAESSYVRVRGVCSTVLASSAVKPIVIAASWSSVTAVAPQLWPLQIVRGSTAIGLPLDPAVSAPEILFKPGPGVRGSIPLNDNLYWWSEDYGTWIPFMDLTYPGDFADPSAGSSYWLGSAVSFVCPLVGFDPTGYTPAWTGLGRSGATVAAFRGLRSSVWNQMQVSDGIIQISISSAIQKGWLEQTGYIWDSSSQVMTAFNLNGSGLVKPGVAYFLTSRRANLALIAPLP